MTITQACTVIRTSVNLADVAEAYELIDRESQPPVMTADDADRERACRELVDESVRLHRLIYPPR
jgi:hypothetical protein